MTMTKVDLVLIQTPFFEDYGPMKKAAGVYFPLGLGYVGAVARDAGFTVRLVDPNVEGQSLLKLARAVSDCKPSLVGISFMTPQFPTAKSLCELLKKQHPALSIVLGGAHPSAMPVETLSEIPEADFVIAGEGEYATLELLRHVIAGDADLGGVAGLTWRSADGAKANSPSKPIDDLDSLPLPARDLIDQRLYRPQSFLGYSQRVAAIYTSRGCPGRCVFCCSGYRLRAPVRVRSIENVMHEIDRLVGDYGIDYLLIKDDTFTLKKERVRAFCAALRCRHPTLKWHCMGRVNSVDEALLAEMADAGLHDIFFGIESGNDDILKRAQKGTTTQLARAAVDACDRLGIDTYGAFILGLPGETRETARQTIDFACSLPLTLAGFSVLIPYPGTVCFAQYYRQAPGRPLDYRNFIASTGIHYVREYTGLGNNLRVEELPALVSEAQQRFYLRPRQVLRLLRGVSPSKLRGYARGFAALVAKEVYIRGGMGG
jgi:anaerobic magnesium-protoporphyrin IX monomethyl ester cyclase